ncbi:anthocyanidin-3-O-glucoside rhamnosyltransferase-like [Pistacia vera]|uniref:anthocyanidin-3-O-glucoside rhamnosyltransferase-like n=1 Tax=Pistacia vera TaxID=55513 RepID=UPI0012638A17|nr:anthocyanidin-3-O-glucoside rhamnosyltransferase-like [Pistacia vera]
MASHESTDSLHVVMFPWFAYGHISPFVQLSNKLSLHGVKVSFLSTPSTVSRIKSTINLNPGVHLIPVSIPHIEGISPGLETTSDMTPAMAELLKQAVDLMQPQIKTLLSQLKPHFVFFDFVYYWLPYLASQLGIKTLYFSVYSAISDNYNLAVSRRNNHTIHDFMKPPAGFPTTSLTSLTKFEAGHSFYVLMNFDGHPSVYDRALEGYNGSTAILMKTCNEMEGPYVEYKKTQFQKPVLLTGPLVSEPPSGELDERWSKWLVRFPPKSVIFCSFGSETFLNNDQIKELALGLELTGLPFFLVVNFPANVDAEIELVRALPEGLTERVKDIAVVHTGWVQQQLILAHNSVGCYVCHSGFSSVLEAIMNDRQLVLLPCKGDQFLNAKLIAGDLRAGVEVNRREDDGHFHKKDIFEAVKTVMVDVNKEPGMSIRENHKKWREFLRNEEIQNKFIADLVKDLKDLA